KYNRAGGRILVSTHGNGSNIVLTVGNTGRPIPPGENIFERFHHSSTPSAASGHGIGLNLARKLARLHGGDLRLVCSENDWTDFGADVRLDEYALRMTPWQDGRFTLQVGKFATVVGNWVPRHLSWENPFINAPLVYENVTAIQDKYAPYSPLNFIYAPYYYGKYTFNPVIWGPDYATGISMSGKLGRFDYAVELKNASLSSRPESWNFTENGLENPTFSARAGFRPNEAWNF